MFKKVTSYVLMVCLFVTQLGNTILVTRSLATLAVMSLSIKSNDLWADAISDKGIEGQEFARDIMRNYDQTGADEVTGVITLYPDTAPKTINANELFPDMVLGAINDEIAANGNEAALSTATLSRISELMSESSTQGSAYRTLNDSITGRSHPNMSTDPVFVVSDNILSGLDPVFLANFQDCAVIENTGNTVDTIHLPDLKTCKRVNNAGTKSCKAIHTLSGHTDVNYTTSIVRANIAKYQFVIGGQGHITTITIQYNLLTGQVVQTAYTNGTHINKMGRVYSSTMTPVITAAQYNQYCGGGANASFSVGGFTQSHGSGANSVSPTCANGMVGKVIYTDHPGYSMLASQYLQWNVTIGYPTKVIDVDQWDWDDPTCPDLFANVSDGYCSAPYSCTIAPNGAGCIDVSGMTICPSDPLYASISLPPPELTGIDRLCKEVTVNGSCDFNTGVLDCYTDINGIEQCPTNDGSDPNGCAAYESNPSCAFLDSNCVEGAEGLSGTCYAFNEIWDCGYDVNVDNVVVSQAVDCAGPLRCMGTDCSAPMEESSQDFARAVATTKAISMMKMDADCVDAVNCEVFKGEAFECKEALGGIVDCCEEPSGGPGLNEYMSLLSMVGEVDAAIDSMDSLSFFGMDIKGGWDALSVPVDQLYSTATSTFTSAVESMTGSAAVGETAASLGFKQTIMNQAATWTTDIFGADAAATLFTEVSPGVFNLGGASAWLGNLIGWAFTLYTIYQVIVLLINLLWQCEEREFQLGSKRKLKSCHFIGSYCKDKILGVCVQTNDSYCCYNSPLSRIFQEQVRPVMGLSFGTAEAPICEGLIPSQIAAADLTGVNLDEYIAILQVTGQMPTAAQYDTKFNLDALTGSGNALNTGSRTDTATRTLNRAGQMGNDPDVVREQIRSDLYGN